MSYAVPAKAYKGFGMEGLTARWYASYRNALDEFKALALRVAAQIPAGSDVLEVAPGPGYFAVELAKRGAFSPSAVLMKKSIKACSTPLLPFSTLDGVFHLYIRRRDRERAVERSPGLEFLD